MCGDNCQLTLSQRRGAVLIVILVMWWTEETQATCEWSSFYSASADYDRARMWAQHCEMFSSRRNSPTSSFWWENHIKILTILMLMIHSILKNNGVDQTQQVYMLVLAIGYQFGPLLWTWFGQLLWIVLLFFDRWRSMIETMGTMLEIILLIFKRIMN